MAELGLDEVPNIVIVMYIVKRVSQKASALSLTPIPRHVSNGLAVLFFQALPFKCSRSVLPSFASVPCKGGRHYSNSNFTNSNCYESTINVAVMPHAWSLLHASCAISKNEVAV